MSQLLHLPDLAAPRTRMGSALAAGARVKQGEAGTARGWVLRLADPVRRECRVPVPLPPPPLLAAGRRGDDDDDNDVDEDRQRYYLNLGYAIRTLREELPDVLCKDHSFDIYRFQFHRSSSTHQSLVFSFTWLEDSTELQLLGYQSLISVPSIHLFFFLTTVHLPLYRDDIVFRDPLNTFKGLGNYKRLFWALRLTGRVFFRASWVEVVSIWQPAENSILLRWTAHGVPRVPWGWWDAAHARFDGASVYKLDRNGKIYEHKVHNVATNPPAKSKVLPVHELVRSLGCPSTAQPTCSDF
jgi:hypothetical protein